MSITNEQVDELLSALAEMSGLDEKLAEQLERLLNLYNLERYLFEVVSLQFQKSGTLTSFDFFAIIIWKSNRTKTKIKNGLAVANKTVESLMQEVNRAETPLAKVRALLQIKGIGIAMASAILAVCYPDDFTILDYRVWETLQKVPIEGLPDYKPGDVESYLQYCHVCKRIAEHAGLSLRNLDRALWAKSWEQDLFDLIGA